MSQVIQSSITSLLSNGRRGHCTPLSGHRTTSTYTLMRECICVHVYMYMFVYIHNAHTFAGAYLRMCLITI